MRLLLATIFALVPAVATAGPDEDARAAVAVELAKLALRKPPAFEKVSFDGGRTWQLRPVTAAPGVVAPSPFVPLDPFGILRTPAPPVGTSPRPAPAPGSSAATPQAVTYTSAPRVIRSGGTNCPTGNCPYR